MIKVTVTQINWNGRGDNRSFTYWVKPDRLARRLARIEQAYNMDHTTVAFD